METVWLLLVVLHIIGAPGEMSFRKSEGVTVSSAALCQETAELIESQSQHLPFAGRKMVYWRCIKLQRA